MAELTGLPKIRGEVLRYKSTEVTTHMPGNLKSTQTPGGKMGKGKGNNGRGGAEGHMTSRWKPYASKSK